MDTRVWMFRGTGNSFPGAWRRWVGSVERTTRIGPLQRTEGICNRFNLESRRAMVNYTKADPFGSRPTCPVGAEIPFFFTDWPGGRIGPPPGTRLAHGWRSLHRDPPVPNPPSGGQVACG